MISRMDWLPNEDCGQMSAWYIISALGFYAVDPVSGNYVFGSPLVHQAEVDLGNGKNLELRWSAHRLVTLTFKQ